MSTLIRFSVDKLGFFYINQESAAHYHLNNSVRKVFAMADLVDKDAVVFDVGANCGLFSSFVGLLKHPRQIVAFEADKSLEPALKANLSRVQSPSQICLCGVGETAQTKKFFINPQSRQTNSFLESAVRPFLDGGEAIPQAVQVINLDEFCSGSGLWPTVMKVHVQGMEGEVLRGARDCLRNVQQLFVEVSWLDMDSVTSIIPFARYYGFDWLYVMDLVQGGADLLLSRGPVDGAGARECREIRMLKNNWA